MAPNDDSRPKKPPMSSAELEGLRAPGYLREQSGRAGPVASIGVPTPPHEPPAGGGGPDSPAVQPDDSKPLKAILGRPRLKPGETKEEAARRLARELFGTVKPADDGAGDSANDDTHGRQGTP